VLASEVVEPRVHVQLLQTGALVLVVREQAEETLLELGADLDLVELGAQPFLFY